ncbi:LysM peptidoglycan-binding domain-containing protein [Hymenobacter armeniacus]|uniref:LysM peptidoglycan-binding domain-containing protein n=1 Tax=Hymenobacter armeniacus TaxID=2771358 RepID=A0ABR8JZE5_9BACT|nr:LysM peptidoglycan-binding domain-containing protein [Hymenobacter armeniacus]MBD2724278.1 LysM peptidoglycan-binding domain-containing protein [Hymenobacter armeniacus]
MRNPVALLLLLSVFLTGRLAAQPAVPAARPSVPAAFDVAGLHLVLNPEAQRLVQQKADGLSRHQPSFQARVNQADAAFPIIDRVLREEGVPLDFRYLVLQESALIGDAQSVHEAVGYWQLKRETATGLGLVVNDEVDQRKHLVASTRAAARYLSQNNKALHNWLNALLSYNTGPNGVQPYTLPSDFDATEMAITEATSPYVLMFLAHKLAFEPFCGLNPAPALRLQEFPAVAGQTLEAQALALHADPAALATHNRWLLAAAVPADRAYTLVVPVGDVTQAAGIAANQRLQTNGELLAMPAVGTNTAEVRLNNLRALVALPGETTADLARRGHRRQGEFLRDNELKAFDVAVTGRPYFLERKRDVGPVEYHVLQPGESMFDVAQKYGMRQKAVLNKNRMARNEELRPGRLLWLQHTRPRETAVEYRSLAESVALERPSVDAATTNTDVLLDQANAPVAERRSTATESGQVKIKTKVKTEDGKIKTKRVVTDEADGWGETLSTASAAAAPAAPAPVPTPAPPVAVLPAPVRPAAPAATLPPPAPAPVSEPLADEPAPETLAPAPAEPVASRPAVEYKPASRPVEASVAAPTVSAPKPAASAPKPVSVPLPAAPAAPATPAALPATHRVEAHESVYSVARRYGLPPATLMALNNLTPASGLVIGQVLVLKAEAAPTAVPAATAPAPRPVPVARPAAAGTNPALYVPKAAVTPPPATAATTQHTVAKGETLYSIARLYKVTVADLKAWNAKTDDTAKVGEVLQVQAGAK